MPHDVNTIYEALKTDHREVEDMIERLQTARGDRRMEILDEIALELIPHAKAEEITFYQHLRPIEDGTNEADLGDNQHAMAEELIGECYEALESQDRNFLEKCRMLAETVRTHVREEESVMFGMAQNNFDDDEQAQILADFQRAKEEIKESMKRVASRRRAGRERGGAQPSA